MKTKRSKRELKPFYDIFTTKTFADKIDNRGSSNARELNLLSDDELRAKYSGTYFIRGRR